MPLFSLPRPAAVAALVLAPVLAGTAAWRAPAFHGAPQAPRDTTLVFETGDHVQVTVRPMTATGTEICAALGRSVQGRKTLFAQNDAHTSGAGLPTTLRFPGAGVTPLCTRHRHTAGDTVYFQLTRQWLDPMGRVHRVTVGHHALPLDALWRRRVTFRWVRDGDRAPRDTPPGEG